MHGMTNWQWHRRHVGGIYTVSKSIITLA